VAKDDEAGAVLTRLLAHDLRNPLTAVQLNAQLIERAAAEAGREKEQRRAALIVGAARRLDGLIQQLVEAERVRLGHLQLRREPVAWSELWRGLLAEGSAEFDPRRVRAAMCDERVMVSVDRERLVRALRGLLALAMQEADGAATVLVEVEAQDGGVKTSIHAPRPSGEAAARDPVAGASPSRPMAFGIALHFAQTMFECHGGSVRVKDADPRAIGFELALPTAATSAHT
jgi:K+-sensing histidine kinase KdpD